MAQSASDLSSPADTILDPSPFITGRAAGLGGALSTLADGHDAVYFNPAGIGNSDLKRKGKNATLIDSFFFPYAGVSLNDNAKRTRAQLNAQQAQNDAQTGAAILDANGGERQYARASLIPLGLTLGRTIILPVVDHQMAAVPVGEQSGQVKLRYRSYTGVILGGSISDRSQRLSLGVSQSFGTIEETFGTFQYSDMVDSYQRKKILKDNRKTYAAKGLTVGGTLRIPRAFHPAFSLVARNMGNTANTATSEADKPLVYEEDLTAGFSVSPILGRYGCINLIFEASHLTQNDMAARKKVRGGVELLLGGEDSKSLLGVRAGGNDGGWSAGVHFNLGLISVAAETHAVDVGLDNNRLIERRTSGVVFIDLGSI
jgi:hypothetical protein